MTLPILESLQQVWLLGLLGLWAVFLFGGFVLGKWNEDQAHRIPRPARMIASLILVVAGWSWCLLLRGTDLHPLARAIAIGMTFGFIGDLFMAEILPFPNRVLGGMGAFGVGHIAYIIGLLGIGEQYGWNEPGVRWGTLLVWLLISAVLWYILLFRGQERGVLHYMALPYALLLASTTGFATGLALQHGAFIPLAIGAALFLLSDLILAIQLFNGLHFRSIGDVVWFTYSPGQMLIVYALIFATLLNQPLA